MLQPQLFYRDVDEIRRIHDHLGRLNYGLNRDLSRFPAVSRFQLQVVADSSLVPPHCADLSVSGHLGERQSQADADMFHDGGGNFR